MNREALTDVMQLYGVGDLATALKVPHGYVTPLLNRGDFYHTHQWRRCRLFTRERLEQIVHEHGTLIRAGSYMPNQVTGGNNPPLLTESPTDEA